MKKVLLLSMAVWLIGGMAFSLPLQQRAEKQIIITATQTGIYKFPSETTAQLGAAKHGEKFVTLGRTTEGWYQIRFGEDFAYVRGSDAEVVSTPMMPAKAAESQPEAVQPKVAPKKIAAKEETPAAVPPRVEEKPAQPIPVPPVEQSRFPWIWVVVGALFVSLIILMIARSARETHRLEDRLRHKMS